MFNTVKSFIQRYRPRIYWGRCPAYLFHPALVLFPYDPNRLCCGLVGILEFRNKSEPAQSAQVVAQIQNLVDQLKKGVGNFSAQGVHRRSALIKELGQVSKQCKRSSVFYNLFRHKSLRDDLLRQRRDLKAVLEKEEKIIDQEGVCIPSNFLELINNDLVALRDIIWSIETEVEANLDRVKELLGQRQDSSPHLIQGLRKLNFILNNLDRLEIRGRDSAGMAVMVTFPDPSALKGFMDKIREQGLSEQWEKRTQLRDLLNGHICCHVSTLTFTFKVCAEIGKLGDNVAFLRRIITQDPIFHLALEEPGIFTNTIAHTRWASVGMISEENCHPVNNARRLKGQPKAEILPHSSFGSMQVVLNGDIDNYAKLKTQWENCHTDHCISERITTDTKIIPLQVEEYLSQGLDLTESFRKAVNDFEGSQAIAMQSDLEPERIFLALRGSGQSIFVGIGEEGYFPASEIYGFVEETPRFIKMDGEKERIPGEAKTQGQIFILDERKAGGLAGITAMSYDGSPLSLSPEDIQSTQITTRDIDRRGFSHYFMKEISEFPLSVQKTIRGKVDLVDGRMIFNLGKEIIPPKLEQALVRRAIKHIYLVGQGTAGIAAEGIAMLLKEFLSNSGLQIAEKKASELSGFCLDTSMTHTLVIAVTQSGTTTDTNKAVDMARNAGAYTLAIVNRRDSDITYKTDGVFYTSDGRDIEMSVASTKAFYSQIVAGYLLGLRFAQIMNFRSEEYLMGEVKQLKRLPRLMTRILREKQDQISASAKKWALSRRHWAVVGSGPNKVAADEIRIKLSELCYKTLPADVVEDRKHIDLSAEPLVLVCAAGSREIVLGDIIKDVAIFKAHKATTIIIANEGESRFDLCADTLIKIPVVSERLAPILNTLIGHLWGYYAALYIDEEADFLKNYRRIINQKICDLESAGRNPLEIIFDLSFQHMVNEAAFFIHQKNSDGIFNAAIKPGTIADLLLLLKYAGGKLPLTDLTRDFGGGINNCLQLLQKALDQAINELSRPIDAIKHQAKTVTVGTSRLPELLGGHIFDAIQEIGLSIDKIASHNLAELKRLQPAIRRITGYTLYEVDQLNYLGSPTEESTIKIVDRGGISKNLSSRVEKSSRLRGNKRNIVNNNTVFIGLGKADNAKLLIVPAQGKNVQQKMVLLFHIEFEEKLPIKAKIIAMGEKYENLVDALAEVDILWQDKFLAPFSTADLFSKSEETLVEAIRANKEHE